MQTRPGALKDLDGPELEYFVLARLERLTTRMADARDRDPAFERLARHAASLAIADCLRLGLASEMVVILEEAFGDLARA